MSHSCKTMGIIMFHMPQYSVLVLGYQKGWQQFLKWGFPQFTFLLMSFWTSFMSATAVSKYLILQYFRFYIAHTYIRLSTVSFCNIFMYLVLPTFTFPSAYACFIYTIKLAVPSSYCIRLLGQSGRILRGWNAQWIWFRHMISYKMVWTEQTPR